MRIAFVQLNPQFGQIKTNVDKALAMMESQPAELYVLPELFNTGYVFTSKEEATSLAEPVKGGYTFKAIADFAKTKDAAVVYGFAEKASEGLYNSAVFIDGQGNTRIYRKLHLFLKERDYFLPGNYPLDIIPYRGAKLGMMVCFDWIFPEVCRTLALLGAELICHPANLVMPFCQKAMVTRSIENRVFTITANRVGEEDRGGTICKFTGQSQITDCQGRVLYYASSDKEEIYCADIDEKEAQNKNVNEINNLWLERRTGFYNILGEK
jgi:predicted amidohydrolase